MVNMVNLRNDLVFGLYSKDRLNGSISTSNLPVTFLLKDSSNKSIIDKNLINKELFVNNISPTHIHLSPSKTFPRDLSIVPFTQITGDLLFNKEKIEVDDLLKELRLKDATFEFQQLFNAQLQNGRYIGDYFSNESSLIYFFNKNETNFFALETCLHDDQFYFPKHPQDKQNLIDFIAETSPHLVHHLDNLFFSHPEYNNTKSSKMNP